VRELRKYLIYKQSYSQFSVEIYQFLLPWQQGSVCRNLNHSEIDWRPKHPVWCRNLRLILHLSRFIVNVVCIFADFSYHGNRSWTDTFRLHIGRPKNPLFGTGIFVMYHIQAELNTNFQLEFSNFFYHGNKGGSSKNLNETVWLADPQNPQFGAKNVGPLLNLTRFIVNFVWKFADFHYHGNRGWSGTKYTFIVKVADP